MSSTSYISASTNPLKRSHSTAFRPSKLCPSGQQAVMATVFRPRKKARLIAPAPSPVPQFLSNGSADELDRTEDLKEAATIQLLSTIREKRKINEANFLLLASEHHKAKNEFNAHVVAHKRIIDELNQLHMRFRKVWDNKKKEDLFRGAVLMATRDNLRKQKADMLPASKRSSKQFKKLEAKLVKSRKLLEEEISKEKELVKTMGKATKSAS